MAKQKQKIDSPQTPQKKTLVAFRYVWAVTVKEKAFLLDFIGWMALPRDERKPTTMAQFAKQCGLHRDTLSDWKNLPGFWDEVSMYRSSYFRKYSSDVFYGLVKAAKTGNPKAIELFAKIFEGYGDKERPEIYPTPACEQNLTEEEVAKLNWGIKTVAFPSAPMNSEE
jgi:hypothetical protein